MSATLRFLYLEDQSADVELVEAALAREYIACELSWVNGRAAFESALAGGWAFDLILADYQLPDIDGDLALVLARKYSPNVPFIFISGSLGEEKAVECLRAGATDYVLKSHLARLGPVVRRALEEAREANARREAEAATQRVVALLRATLESTSEGILVTDLAGRVSTYNRKFMTLCGIPDYVMAPMEMDRVLGFLLDQFQDPEAFLAEARQLIPHPDGESRA
jgi:DNA-binding NtrC family response regulator